MVLTQRLTQINVYGPANNGADPNVEVQARRYRLSYAQASTGTRMPRLIAVQECAPALGAVAEVCYPPTRFAWNNEADNDFPQGFVAPASASNYSKLLNYAVDFKVGDINGDGRQDLVYIKDRNCAGNATFPNDLISDATSAVRFRYMVALGQDTGLQTASPADIFPLRTPPGAAQIPSCDSNGAATQFEGNEAIRWDLIWHLFDLTGDGRDDLIAQVPDFSACTTCFRWQVYPAQLEGGSFWTFAAVGIDLNLTVTQDLDSSLADWTGEVWLA